MRSFTTLGLATLVAAASMAGAQAQTTLTTTATSYIRPAGPVAAPNGTNFLDVEGGNNTTFATFAVADFTPMANPTARTISNLVLTLTEADAFFTAPGTINIYLASNDTVATSGLTYNASQPASGGIGTQLGTLYNLGTFSFTSTGNTNTGQVDTYTLSLANQAAQSLFLNELNTGSTIRLAIGGDQATPGVAATFFGATGQLKSSPNQVVAPTLSFNTSAPVPEASTTASFGLLLVLGLGGVAVARRRKQA